MSQVRQGATDLDAIRARLAPRPGVESERRPIGLRAIHLGPQALDELPRAVAEAASGAGAATSGAGAGAGAGAATSGAGTAPSGDVATPRDVVVLTDATPMRRGPDDLKADAVALLRSAFGADRVRHVVIGPDRPELHADAAALAEAEAAIDGADVVVSVGSGTITDVAKDAAHRADRPFVVVQTAVSVNAFSDDMAVLLRDGVKRTVPSRWPDALVIDLRVIADAPAAMNRAGFGELTAMFTAPADWYLASAVTGDGSFDPGVVELYRERGELLLDHAAGVAGGELVALEELAAQMTLTGIAMGVAGRTAPLSGTEHTISHLLDMVAGVDGRGTALHGAQVGVAAVIVALAWRRVLRDLDPDRLARDAAAGRGVDLDVRHVRVAAAFDRLDPDGAATAECWADYRRKAERWNAATDRRAALARDWEAHRRVVEGLVLDPARIVDGLRAAGAPTRFSELEPAIPAEAARWAIASCHLMRDRFTVADLVDLGGAAGTDWDAAFADDLLDEAAELGAGR